jgi:hypothetical protein
MVMEVEMEAEAVTTGMMETVKEASKTAQTER